MMKRLALLVVGVAVLGMAASAAQVKPVSRPEQWKKVDEAAKKGLPKTAIELLEPIITGAKADKAYAEAIKAVALKIAYEGNIQGNKPEEKITRLQKEVDSAPKEMKPVLEAILANWYWHYFQQNRWRFSRRSTTAAAPSDDFTTWDLPRILGEIDKQFDKALAARVELKKIPVAQYDALLNKGTLPDTYRPTLFDFVAFSALEFYSSGEQAGSKAEDAFELLAESPALNSATDFVAWKIETTDTASLKVKALKLYQELLSTHAKDDDRTAYLDADRLRLQYAYNTARGEEKAARYKAALKKYIDGCDKHELSAYGLYHLASVIHGENDYVEARATALRGSNAFPNSLGGKLCFNLVQQIEAKSSNFNTERVWAQPWPTIRVSYRNITQAHFRIVADDYEARLKGKTYRPEYLSRPEQLALLAKKPTLEWSEKLPETADYQQRTEDLKAPEDLKPGFYFLIASHNDKFNEANNVVSYTPFWVSDLAIVVRSRWGEPRIDGFVLNNNTGEPIVGAEVTPYATTNTNARTALPVLKTDANGQFQFSGQNQRQHLLLVTHGAQMLASSNDFYVYSQTNTPRPHSQVVFFTDRALYRPGQTVHYKGIVYNVDTENDKYSTGENRALNVIFSDVNGKEIAKHAVKSNDYGSFSGSFTAPADRLMGNMSIRAEGAGISGGTNFSVEEYKRPKFQVSIDKPKTAPKLNGDVEVVGKATSYTGAAIDGADVRFRVVRQVRYPGWWYYRYWWGVPQASSQEIAHGRAKTKTDGSFEVKFIAKPDLSVAEKDEPTFQFTVYADVTDTNGETRSASTSTSVAYTALQASVSTASEWNTVENPIGLTIRTTTHDGEGQVAEGSIKIYKLVQPAKVTRTNLMGRRPSRPMPRVSGKGAAAPAIVAPQPDPHNINSWELGEVAFEQGFSTPMTGSVTVSAKLAAGPYRVKVQTQDRFGKPVSAELPLSVYDPSASKLGIKLPEIVAAPTWTVEPGFEFMLLWGTGYDQGRTFVEIEHRKKIVQSFWTPADKTQLTIKHAVTEAMRGGFTVRLTMVRENRAHMTNRRVDVPWTNKQLVVKLERFVSKLQPGQKETFTAIVTGPDAKKAIAEMVAGMYDASLDQYRPHSWMSAFNVFRQDYANINSHFDNFAVGLGHLHGNYVSTSKDTSYSYRTWPHELTVNLWGYGYFGRNGMGGGRGGMPMAPAAAAPQGKGENRRALADEKAGAFADGQDALRKNANGEGRAERESDKAKGEAQGSSPGTAELGTVAARKNLNETAFFFPHLVSDKDGEVKIEFTIPEALTKWNFFSFAHDKELRAGAATNTAVTSKDLMVQPNPPRFLREGDVLEFTVKVTNQSAGRQTGTVRLTLNDARTNNSVDAALGLGTTDQPFDIPQGESRSFSWKLSVPDDLGFLTYKAVGSTGRISDGEEGYLPVLSKRIFVTESLPLPIRGPAEKKFTFTKLTQSGASTTLKHKALTVQMVSNPSWYAVMALPYLMEYPHECSEQVFNRLYANELARHIANSDPKIRRIFDQWKGTPALDSPLEKNQDLKSVMLEETPWLRQANKESQARRNVGILFDANRLDNEAARLFGKLSEMQLGDGAWPWFPGGRGNEYITLYITTGFGRMRHLGVKVDATPAIKSLNRLDAWIDQTYRDILKHSKNKDDNHLSSTIALYLYGRSFFLKDKAIDPKHKEAVDYFLGQAKKYWLQLSVRQSQAHLAIALKRFGDVPTSQGIMKSIKERSVSDEELGLFWRDTELSWWWYRAPIETQAMMIEAFDEVMNDTQAVEDAKVWLLKQKQTQDWKTTKATADAVYALLLRGSNLLASDALVEVSLGGETIKPEKVEAGTGFYEQKFHGGEIKPVFGNVGVKKVDQGVAWGSVHWQYLEDASKVTPYDGTPLKLKKTLFTKEFTKQGPVLKPVAGNLSVGDEVVVRVELRVDRDMEYVHLKDQRGSGTEPVNVLSSYKFQDGLYYYESTRDTASHFFIDYLPKGTYVFEYSTRVVHKGQYQTGIASIQSMYAPEFNSHSESFNLTVK